MNASKELAIILARSKIGVTANREQTNVPSGRLVRRLLLMFKSSRALILATEVVMEATQLLETSRRERQGRSANAEAKKTTIMIQLVHQVQKPIHHQGAVLDCS